MRFQGKIEHRTYRTYSTTLIQDDIGYKGGWVLKNYASETSETSEKKSK